MEIIESKVFKTKIVFGELMNNFGDYIKNDRIIVIADDNVMKLYPKIFLDHRTITIHSSEKSKDIDTIRFIYDKLLELDADKDSFILGVGGGVISDITGFVASTFMRGTKFGFMPTTLLAMSDAALGGKNGVNFGGIKNLIGVINQPDYILTDIEFLNTLSEKDLYAGFSEMIKTALIWNREFFHYLNNHEYNLLRLNKDALLKAIYATSLMKQEIVEKDQFDLGIRKYLNFGHTFGHAIEAEYGESLYLTHGEAVAMGMILALRLSVIEGILDNSIKENIELLLKKYHLPYQVNLSCKNLINKIQKDKKKKDNFIDIILLEDIARPVIKKYDIIHLEEICNDIFNF